jgi:DNA segregation ATPase FtsK/SpoIIIE-like protein
MQISNGRVPLFWDAALLRQGIRYPVWWDYRHCPHVLTVGGTGSGKTYATKLILGKIAKYIPGAKATVLDFKADDYNFLRGYNSHYEFMDCVQGLESVYSAFLARMQGNNPEHTFRLLMFDEWASFLNTLEKKEADVAKKKLSTLLMLGRGYNYHVLVVQQRADAQYFNTARDNFNVIIALGNLSKESALMLGFDRDKIQPVSGIGSGYMLTNGNDLRGIKVPTVKNLTKLENAIRKLVC